MKERLVEALAEQKVDSLDFESYLYALHAKERNERIARINPRYPDGGSGMTNAEADAGADGSGDGVGPSGADHVRFRTWKEELNETP